ncbi:hypothetical protein GRI89_01425 [Altererythrobacter salegens]|uniref:Uncharacterized protein n=1 Tax=Croceibacterium salegens TaxID=1737568 RepID=A0A6I4STH7_9SPHN|nr:hypothetical protein [Croceibacterium salegens]MXO58206.1 hypothetical protein [Croceibacterium salegens]
MPRRSRDRVSNKGTVSKALGGARKAIAKVPGPSTNAATNLLIADIAMRASSRLFRKTMEKGLLRLKFPAEQAHDIVEGKTMGHTLMTAAVARIATRSVPGALAVAGVLFGKAVIDRSMGRRKSSRRGMRRLNKQAENAD